LRPASFDPQSEKLAGREPQLVLTFIDHGDRAVECNTDPAALPPNDVTVVMAKLDADDKIECSGNADLAFDLKIRTANRHISDQAIDPRAVERDCSGLYDFLALDAAVFAHQNPLMPKRSKFP